MRRVVVLLLLLLLALALLSQARAAGATSETPALPPVVIVPGDASSQVQVRLNLTSVNYKWCAKTVDWHNLWLSLKDLVPGLVNCWCDNAALGWNATTGAYANTPGVFTRVPGFGSTETVEYLDPNTHNPPSPYMNVLVSALVNASYVRNASLRAAPYDFRYAAESDVGAAYLRDLQQLVEDTYASNGNASVVLLSHSMGCLYTLKFLTTMSQAWKDQYIALWLPTSGAFGGSVEEVRGLASGDNSNISILDPLLIRVPQRTYQSNYWLLPTAAVYGDAVLASTPHRNYTARDYGDFFADAGYPDGALQAAATLNFTTRTLPPPLVPVVHLHGVSVPTNELYVWNSTPNHTFPDGRPSAVNGDGDGTINLVSLQAVEKWGSDAAQAAHGGFRSRTFPFRTHKGLLFDKEYIQEVLALLRNVTTPTVGRGGGGGAA